MSSKGLTGRGTLAEPVSDPSPAPSRREVFDVLSNRRRQCVLHYLKRTDEDEDVDLRELVDYVAAWESNSTLDAVDPADRKRVYNALRQTHLPKLDEAGVINYDRAQNRIELTDATRDVQLYLEYVPGGDIPWHACYLGLVTVSAVLVGANWVGLYPFGELSGVAVAGLVLAVFALAAAVHAREAQSNRIETDERFSPGCKR